MNSLYIKWDEWHSKWAGNLFPGKASSASVNCFILIKERSLSKLFEVNLAQRTLHVFGIWKITKTTKPLRLVNRVDENGISAIHRYNGNLIHRARKKSVDEYGAIFVNRRIQRALAIWMQVVQSGLIGCRQGIRMELSSGCWLFTFSKNVYTYLLQIKHAWYSMFQSQKLYT